ALVEPVYVASILAPGASVYVKSAGFSRFVTVKASYAPSTVIVELFAFVSTNRSPEDTPVDVFEALRLLSVILPSLSYFT
ncbi:hypothetical protein, partial [Aneurinibacillus migulanus]|uniref:hypothetical protein n=1 Tax=Aneurinibacillus migulanus TaxID=47500 RepID=UPI0013792B9A